MRIMETSLRRFSKIANACEMIDNYDRDDGGEFEKDVEMREGRD